MPLTIGDVSIPTHPVPLAERIAWCNATRDLSDVDRIRLEFAAAALATRLVVAPKTSLVDLGDIFAAALAERTPEANDGMRWLACQSVAIDLLTQTWGGPRAAEVAEVADFSDPTTGGGPSLAVSSPTAGEAMPSSG